jgi:hypothetical protein
MSAVRLHDSGKYLLQSVKEYSWHETNNAFKRDIISNALDRTEDIQTPEEVFSSKTREAKHSNTDLRSI